jgi:hypothetical protein
MSQQQLADLEAERALMTPEELADERMYMAHTISFWKQKAWRAEQQRDREIAERKATEAQFERFKAIPQEALDALLLKMKEEKVAAVKKEASKIIGYIPWVKYELEEKTIQDVDAKLEFWTKLISYYKTMEHEDT